MASNISRKDDVLVEVLSDLEIVQNIAHVQRVFMDMHVLSHEQPIWKKPSLRPSKDFFRRILIFPDVPGLLAYGIQSRASPLPEYATPSSGVVPKIGGFHTSFGGRADVGVSSHNDSDSSTSSCRFGVFHGLS